MSGLRRPGDGPRRSPPISRRCSPGAWTALTPAELARRPVVVAGRGELPLGDVCELTGTPDGTIRFTGDLSRVTRLGAGLTEGAVVVGG